jgi:hypothetical protein
MAVSARWVLVSYMTIGGAMLVAHAVLTVHGASAGTHAYWVYSLGSLTGGMLAARASRGRTVADAAVGAVLVAATMVAISQWVDVYRLTDGFDTVGVPLSAAVVALAGGVAGAKLGERLGTSDGWWFTATLAALHIIGACLACAALSGLAVRVIPPGVVWIAAIVAPMIGGAVTQAAMTDRAAGPVACAAVVLAGGTALVAITKGLGIWSSLFVGFILVLALLAATGLAALGASIAYRLGWAASDEPESIAVARVIERDG